MKTEIKCSNGDIYIIETKEIGISIQKKDGCQENICISERNGNQHQFNDNLIYIY
jgi:hypothetical protein